MIRKKLFGITFIFLILLSPQIVVASSNVPVGDWDYCSNSNPCSNGQGDCDSNEECVYGLTCEENVGPKYGYTKGVDVCVGDATSTSSNDDNTTSNPYIGGPNTSSSSSVNEQPTTTTSGDCSNPLYALLHQSECINGGDTTSNSQQDGTNGCGFAPGHPDYCFSCGPCDEGVGGCHSDDQCKPGLWCDVAKYGGTFKCKSGPKPGN